MALPELRTVLAATDLGPGGEEVVRTAAEVAAAAGAELHVLHAFDFAPDPYPELVPLADDSFQGAIEDAERQLAEQVRRAAPEGTRVAGQRVLIDTAARALLDCADGLDADLIVLGPHRRRGMADAFLGSTADRVVRSAKVPCLVARGPLRLPLRRVVAPLDLSGPSRAALQVALAWCRALGAGPGASVDAVHVIPRILAEDEAPAREAAIRAELHREVESVASASGGAPVEVRESVAWGESPADEIVRLAGEWGADLVVLGTHGRGALRRALLGSVAGSVARQAPCPVLLVPPDVES